MEIKWKNADEWYSFSLDMSKVNLDKIQSWIDQGRLDPSKPITIKELTSSRCLHGVKDGVKLLARVRLECSAQLEHSN